MILAKKIIIVISVFSIITSSIVVPVTLLYKNSNLPKELSSASESVRIHDRVYTLEVFLWRDFMPFVEPNGSTMLVAVNIIAEGDTEFPSNINAKKLWIIYEQEVWSTVLEDVESYDASNILRKRVEGGPKWGPGIDVDVVVELITATGEKFYLLTKNQIIYRTD